MQEIERLKETILVGSESRNLHVEVAMHNSGKEIYFHTHTKKKWNWWNEGYEEIMSNG